MKKKIKYLLIGIFIVFLTGCGNSSNTITEIDYSKLGEMIDNKESFILEVVQTGCSHCEEFSPRFKAVLKTNDKEAYSINLYNLQNYNRYTLKKNESIVLLLLRRFYYQKMQEVSLIDQITMTMEELHDAMIVTGLFEKRINKGEMRDILRILRRYHIIDTTGQSDDDQSIIIIYPTILYVLRVQQIEDIDHRLAEYSRQGGDKSEEAREDEDY